MFIVSKWSFRCWARRIALSIAVSIAPFFIGGADEANAGYSWGTPELTNYNFSYGWWSAVARDTDGQPIIAALNAANSEYDYAEFAVHKRYYATNIQPPQYQFNYSYAWSGGPPLFESATSRPAIRLGASGTVHVGYSRQGSVRYLRRQAGVWTDASILPFQVYYLSMALDASGVPFMAWTEYYGGSITQVGFTSAIDPGATYEALPFPNAAMPSLQFDPAGNPVVAFMDGSGHLALAKKTSGTWTLDSPPVLSILDPPSLQLDAQGNPRIAAHVGNADGTHSLAYVWKDGNTWYYSTPSGPSGYTGVSPALVLDAAGMPRIVYGHSVSGSRSDGTFQVRCSARNTVGAWATSVASEFSAVNRIVGWDPHPAAAVDPATGDMEVTYSHDSGQSISVDPTNKLYYVHGTFADDPPPGGEGDPGCPFCFPALTSGGDVGTTPDEPAVAVMERRSGSAVTVRGSGRALANPEIRVFDLMGRQMGASVSVHANGGSAWDAEIGIPDRGAGLYFVRVRGAGTTLIRRVLLH